MGDSNELELNDLNFTKLCGIIHENTGITIGEGRKSMLLSRLRGRLRELEETDFKSYIARLSSEAGEMQELINRVTTNKTLFYRTPRVWEHFRDVAIKDFLAKKTGRPMRIWSAAASSGEEAHTAGMILEDVRAANPGFDYKILGTDISLRVLKQAEAGVYSGVKVDNFRKSNPELFNAHMVADDSGGFQIAPAIKTRLTFKQHNLQKRMKASPFDVVFLRNVLIYFTPEDQSDFLGKIHEVMPPDGTLYIGESESLSRVKTDFDIVEPMVYMPMARKPDA